MSDAIVDLGPLERGYLRVLRIEAALSSIPLLILALVGEGIAAWRWDLPPGLLVGPVVVFTVLSVAVLAPGRWKRWGYAFTGRDLHVAQGWWVRTHTIVPVSRVQHIDVSQGPFERGAGVATLVLHTAGTEHSRVMLPGLKREDAEAIRDAIRARIGDTPW